MSFRTGDPPAGVSVWLIAKNLLWPNWCGLEQLALRIGRLGECEVKLAT
jgi:hypothetical protein